MDIDAFNTAARRLSMNFTDLFSEHPKAPDYQQAQEILARVVFGYRDLHEVQARLGKPASKPKEKLPAWLKSLKTDDWSYRLKLGIRSGNMIERNSICNKIVEQALAKGMKVRILTLGAEYDFLKKIPNPPIFQNIRKSDFLSAWHSERDLVIGVCTPEDSNDVKHLRLEGEFLVLCDSLDDIEDAPYADSGLAVIAKKSKFLNGECDAYMHCMEQKWVFKYLNYFRKDHPRNMAPNLNADRFLKSDKNDVAPFTIGMVNNLFGQQTEVECAPDRTSYKVLQKIVQKLAKEKKKLRFINFGISYLGEFAEELGAKTFYYNGNGYPNDCFADHNPDNKEAIAAWHSDEPIVLIKPFFGMPDETCPQREPEGVTPDYHGYETDYSVLDLHENNCALFVNVCSPNGPRVYGKRSIAVHFEQDARPIPDHTNAYLFEYQGEWILKQTASVVQARMERLIDLKSVLPA